MALTPVPPPRTAPSSCSCPCCREENGKVVVEQWIESASCRCGGAERKPAGIALGRKGFAPPAPCEQLLPDTPLGPSLVVVHAVPPLVQDVGVPVVLPRHLHAAPAVQADDGVHVVVPARSIDSINIAPGSQASTRNNLSHAVWVATRAMGRGGGGSVQNRSGILPLMPSPCAPQR